MPYVPVAGGRGFEKFSGKPERKRMDVLKKFFFLWLSCAAMSLGSLCAQSADEPRIIVTTPGYANIYRYSVETFAQKAASDFKIENVSAVCEEMGEGSSRVRLRIGPREFLFATDSVCPFVRLQYDRNRRQFKGLGFNYIDREGVCYRAPVFKDMDIASLPERWQPQIERLITDRSLLDADRPTVFLIEADIDEEGIVRRIAELNGALKQYSQVFIDKIYDLAVRGWQPATKDGIPVRTVVQFRFVLKRN